MHARPRAGERHARGEHRERGERTLEEAFIRHLEEAGAGRRPLPRSPLATAEPPLRPALMHATMSAMILGLVQAPAHQLRVARGPRLRRDPSGRARHPRQRETSSGDGPGNHPGRGGPHLAVMDHDQTHGEPRQRQSHSGSRYFTEAHRGQLRDMAGACRRQISSRSRSHPNPARSMRGARPLPTARGSTAPCPARQTSRLTRRDQAHGAPRIMKEGTAGPRRAASAETPSATTRT